MPGGNVRFLQSLRSAQEKYHGRTGGYSPHRGLCANAGRQQKIRSGIFSPKMTGAGQQVNVICGFWRARNSSLHSTVMEAALCAGRCPHAVLLTSRRERDGTLPAPAAVLPLSCRGIVGRHFADAHAVAKKVLTGRRAFRKKSPSKRRKAFPSVVAGWSSSVARRAHNPKVVGSNPAPATRKIKGLRYPS